MINHHKNYNTKHITQKNIGHLYYWSCSCACAIFVWAIINELQTLAFAALYQNKNISPTDFGKGGKQNMQNRIQVSERFTLVKLEGY